MTSILLNIETCKTKEKFNAIFSEIISYFNPIILSINHYKKS